MKPPLVLPEEIDAAATEIVAAHARMLWLLRRWDGPVTGWDLQELEELDASCESWLATLRRNVAVLAARESGEQ